MKNFYDSFTFIIAFMILVIIFQFTLGSSFVKAFLTLVLASMVVMNADKFKTVFNGLQQGGNTNE